MNPAQTKTQKCYIARYPLSADGKDLNEETLFRDTFYSPAIIAEWERLIALREPNWKREPMLQCWYADEFEVICMAQTNQPFKLV